MIKRMKTVTLIVLTASLLTTPKWVIAVDQLKVIDTRLKRLERLTDNDGLVDILHQMEGMQKEIRDLRGQVEQQAYTIEQLKNGQGGVAPQQGNEYISNHEGMAEPAAVQDDFKPYEPASSAITIDTPAAAEVVIAPVVTESAREIVIDKRSSSGITPVETFTVDQGQQINDESHRATDLPVVANESAPVSSAKDDYLEAFNLLKLGQYDESVSQFRAYLKRYPGSQYADNAQYWLGEAYYARRQFKPALREYQRLISEHPDSGKISHAQLKIGYCYDELGDYGLAQGELEDLMARFPGTSAATLADERLDLIRSHN